MSKLYDRFMDAQTQRAIAIELEDQTMFLYWDSEVEKLARKMDRLYHKALQSRTDREYLKLISDLLPY